MDESKKYTCPFCLGVMAFDYGSGDEFWCENCGATANIGVVDMRPGEAALQARITELEGIMAAITASAPEQTQKITSLVDALKKCRPYFDGTIGSHERPELVRIIDVAIGEPHWECCCGMYKCHSIAPVCPESCLNRGFFKTNWQERKVIG